MKKVIILGSDITGLLCSYVFRKYGVNPIVIDVEGSGCDFLNGGLQLVYQTRPMEAILDELGFGHSDYSLRGGILLRGKIEKFPAYFKKASVDEADRIKSDYYQKTRLVKSIQTFKRAIPDVLESTRTKRVLRTDFEGLLNKLRSKSRVVQARLLYVNDNAVLTTKGRVEYDHLICTLPLWAVSEVMSWRVPNAMAMRLNTVVLEAVKDEYFKFDYVLTPYTPANYVHRFSAFNDGYKVEVNGLFDLERLKTDLSFLFEHGWKVKAINENLNGYFLPLTEKVDWPRHCAGLGSHAKWDHKVTLDGTLNEAIELARKWFS